MYQSKSPSRLRRVGSVAVAGLLGCGTVFASAASATAAPGDPVDGITIEKTSTVDNTPRYDRWGNLIHDIRIAYEITVTNNTGFDYTDENPLFVVDDGSDLLDDAHLNPDAVPPPGLPGSPIRIGDGQLVWAEPLADGDSLTLYVHMVVPENSSGDGWIHNLAFVPNDPDNPEPPGCDTDEALDPATGEPCDTDTITLAEIPLADPSVAGIAGPLGLGLAGGVALHRRRTVTGAMNGG